MRLFTSMGHDDLPADQHTFQTDGEVQPAKPTTAEAGRRWPEAARREEMSLFVAACVEGLRFPGFVVVAVRDARVGDLPKWPVSGGDGVDRR
jgi:hypothetical protein